MAGNGYQLSAGRTNGCVVLASDSHTLDGCDRVVLAGDRILVQGTPAAYPETAPLQVPAGEALTGISAEVFLDAARELQRRLGRP